MGLSVALSNALSGMSVGQKSLDTLSRNVANAGTPGYHRQSLNVVERVGGGSYVSAGALNRAFSASLQAHYNTEVSNSSYADTRASSLDRLQIAFGKPGQAGSLDTAFNNFQAGLSKLATGTDSAATRAEVVANATTLASTLNCLSSEVQALRQEADTELGNGVNDLNRTLQSLETVNLRLANVSGDDASRATLMDQRDRLVADVAGMIDVNVDYRSNGTISIMTRSGISVLDNKAAVFSYAGVGQISAASEYSADPSKNGVGSLTLRSPSGLQVDLVAENVVAPAGWGPSLNSATQRWSRHRANSTRLQRPLPKRCRPSKRRVLRQPQAEPRVSISTSATFVPATRSRSTTAQVIRPRR